MPKTLTKNELAKQLTQGTKKRLVMMTEKTAIDIVETIADLIACHFANGGDRVIIRGFGTFKIRKRGRFTGFHPKTGESMLVHSRLSVGFKPSAEMTKRINQLRNQI
jgi:nucleoid DNA-binding protein